MRKRLGSIIFLSAMLASSGIASAAINYTYVSDAANYNAAPGQSVLVHIYLQETLTNSSTSLIVARSGLSAGGFAVSVAPNQTNAGTLKSIAGDSTTFDGGFFTDSNPPSGELRGDNLIGPTDTSGPMPKSGLISLGSVTVTASSVGSTVTTYRVGAYAPGTEGYTEVVNLPYDDLDVSNNAGSGSDVYSGAGGTSASPIPYNNLFTVTALVPEPTSLALVLCGLPVLSQCRRWRFGLCSFGRSQLTPFRLV